MSNPNEWKIMEVDPTGRSAKDSGSKLDAGKIRVGLMLQGFSHALREVARVTTKGAEKYTPRGWEAVPDGEDRYMDALGRHLLADLGGNHIDDDTSCYHLAQVAWNALAVLELRLRKEKG